MYQQWRKKTKKIPRLQKKCTILGISTITYETKKKSSLLNVGTHHASSVAVRILGDLAMIVGTECEIQ